MSALQYNRDSDCPRQLNLSEQIEQGYASISGTWSLQNFIANNPMLGYSQYSFEMGVEKASSLLLLNNEKIEHLNLQTIKWLMQIFAKNRNPVLFESHKRCFLSWLECIELDNSILSSQYHDVINMDCPELIIARCFSHWRIGAYEQEQLIAILLHSLPGWAGYIKKCHELEDSSLTPTEYLAMRCIILLGITDSPLDILVNSEFDLQTKSNTRGSSLEPRKFIYERNKYSVQIQYVFCIDVRSQAIRSRLEEYDNIETLGCAGFFGLPIKIHHETKANTSPACPVILEPRYQVKVKQHNHAVAKIVQSIESLFWQLKRTGVSAVGLIEALGIPAALLMLKNTFIGPKNLPAVGQDEVFLDNIPFVEQLSLAEQFIASLCKAELASIVVVCGHKSTSSNNLWASSLDCGACAGQSGEFNARVICQILNQQAVQNHLRQQGYKFPDKIEFVPAIHNTTTDTLHLLDEKPANDAVKKVHQHINNQHDSKKLKLSQSWSESRPEWGLVNNGTFVIGPRSLVRSASDNNQCFMHNFDETMPNAENILAAILAGPVTVAHWINMHYLFASMNNALFGSGSKVTQNPMAHHGVMQGVASDLLTGLPIQSLYNDSGTKQHSEQRLQVVIYASTEMIDQALLKNHELKKLLDNEWLFLFSVSNDNEFSCYSKDGQWQSHV